LFFLRHNAKAQLPPEREALWAVNCSASLCSIAAKQPRGLLEQKCSALGRINESPHALYDAVRGHTSPNTFRIDTGRLNEVCGL